MYPHMIASKEEGRRWRRERERGREEQRERACFHFPPYLTKPKVAFVLLCTLKSSEADLELLILWCIPSETSDYGTRGPTLIPQLTFPNVSSPHTAAPKNRMRTWVLRGSKHFLLNFSGTFHNFSYTAFPFQEGVSPVLWSGSGSALLTQFTQHGL